MPKCGWLPNPVWGSPVRRAARQPSPDDVFTCIQIFEQATDIGRLVSVEVEVNVRRVGVAPLRLAGQQTQCHKGIEEITRTPLMDADSPGECAGIERSLCQRCENPEFDRAEERLGPPEGIAKPDQAIAPDCRRAHARHTALRAWLLTSV